MRPKTCLEVVRRIFSLRFFGQRRIYDLSGKMFIMDKYTSTLQKISHRDTWVSPAIGGIYPWPFINCKVSYLSLLSMAALDRIWLEDCFWLLR